MPLDEANLISKSQAIASDAAALAAMTIERLAQQVVESTSLGITTSELTAEVDSRLQSSTLSDKERYFLASMAAALREKNQAGSSLPVGALQQFTQGNPVIQEGGETWLKTGYIVDEPGSFDSGLAQFNNLTPKGGHGLPYGYAKFGFDLYQGKVYAINSTSNGIDVFENGKAISRIELGHSQIRDLAIDAATGHIFGACYSPDQVVEFNQSGEVVQTHTVVESGESRNILGVAKNSTHFFVLDQSNKQVLQYSLSWTRTAVLSLNTAVVGGPIHIAADDTHLFVTNSVSSGTAGHIAKVEIADPTNIVGSGDLKLGSGGALGIATNGDDLLVALRPGTNDNIGIRCFKKNLSSRYRIDVGENCYGVCAALNHYFVTTGSSIKKYSKEGLLLETYTPGFNSQIYGIAYRAGSFYVSHDGTIRVFDESFQLKETVSITRPTGMSSSTPTYDMCWVEDLLYIVFWSGNGPSASYQAVGVYDSLLNKVGEFQGTLNRLTGIAYKNGRFLVRGYVGGYYYRLVDAEMQAISGGLLTLEDNLVVGPDTYGMAFDGDDLIVSLASRRHIEVFTPIYFAGSKSQITGEAGPYYMRVK